MQNTPARAPYFFGYGSLVNTRTHRYSDQRPALLHGWRRVWRQTAKFPRAILTIEPCADCTIQGLIAAVPDNDWQALDAREHAYDRVLLPHNHVNHDHPDAIAVATYVIAADTYPPAPRPRPIHLSYLDVVIQGYVTEFGPEAAQAFFKTTTGWNAPIRNDRQAPVYARHQVLTATQTNIVDQALIRLGCQFLD